MNNLDHDFDPDGDLILILRGLPPAPEPTDASSPEPGSQSQPPAAADGHEKDSPGAAKPHEASESSNVNGEKKQLMRVRVSSKHLGLASQVLKTFLPREDHFQTDARVRLTPELPLLDDDPAALLILLSIMHGRFWEVSHTADLATLTEVAALVHKYDLRESVSIMSSCWRRNLGHDIPREGIQTTVDDTLLAWLFVAWVFDWRDIWNAATCTAQCWSDDSISSGRFQIPESALDQMNNTREYIISQTFTYLQAAIEGYHANDVCSLECDATVLGYLTIKMSRLGIFTTPPAPYSGFSTSVLFADLRQMDSNVTFNGRRSLNHSRQCKRLTLKLEDTLKSLEASNAPVALAWKAQKLRPGRRTWVLKAGAP